MKAIVIRRGRLVPHKECYVVLCQFGFLAVIINELGCLLTNCRHSIFLPNDHLLVLPEKHMPLRWMFLQMLQNGVTCFWRKNRTVAISIGQYIIQVNMKASPLIKHPDTLYHLAIISLRNSPELKHLPRWMAREIKRRARRIHVISTDATYEHALMTRQLSFIESTDRVSSSVCHLSSAIGIERISRVLIFIIGDAVPAFFLHGDRMAMPAFRR